MLGRVLKLVVVLVVLGLVGLSGYAFLGDLSPETAPQSLTVTLDAS